MKYKRHFHKRSYVQFKTFLPFQVSIFLSVYLYIYLCYNFIVQKKYILYLFLIRICGQLRTYVSFQIFHVSLYLLFSTSHCLSLQIKLSNLLYISIYLSVYLYLSLCIYLSIFLYISIYISVYLLYLSIFLCIYIYLSFCISLSIFL
jgi:hypothetical protein